MKSVVVSGDKGGIGKSTVACLLTEWLTHQGVAVTVTDADPQGTTRRWLEECAEEGQDRNSSNALVEVIDTAGAYSTGTKLIRRADVVVIPFQPHIADLTPIAEWFMSTKHEVQAKVFFLPNRLNGTKEQRDGMREMAAIIEDEGHGEMLPGIKNRPAVYPPLLNGAPINFFERRGRGLMDAFIELEKSFNPILSRLGIEVSQS